MDYADLESSKRFLGQEFLLWLWYRDDIDDGVHPLVDERVELHFDDRLELLGQLAEAEVSALRGGAPSQSPEAHKALQLGKRVGKARLRLAIGEREWVFGVDTETFRFAGIKTPTVLSREDDEPFLERMYLIEELDRTWTALYGRFLTLRLSDDWEAERSAIAAWIRLPTGDEALP